MTRKRRTASPLEPATTPGLCPCASLLAAAFEQGPAMALLVDATGATHYASPALRTQAPGGLDDFDLARTPLGDAGALLREVVGGGRPWAGEVPLRCAGADRWLRASFSPLPGDDGAPALALGLFEDVTPTRLAEQAHRRSETLLTVLYRISNTVHVTRDLPDLYAAIHAILRDVIDATNFFIALVDEERDRLIFPYFEDTVDRAAYAIEGISDPATQSLTLWVIRSGKPLLVRKDELAALFTKGRPGASGVVGTAAEIWLGVPLVVEGKTIGAMAVQDYSDPDHYGQREVHLMTAISEQVAMAIERKRMEQALRVSEKRYRTVSDSAFNMETWRAPDGTLVYVSPSCQRITGYPPEAFMSDPYLMEHIIHRDDLPLWREFVADPCSSAGESMDFRIFREDGRMHWLSVVSQAVTDDDGSCLGLRCSMRDITDQKTMEKQLRYESLHDSLTGLANRSLCLDRIRQTMERSKRRDDHFYALAFLDIDRFRVVNDSLGHQMGDALLREVSYRLLRCVRSLDTVSRYAGDEYVIVFDELVSPREAIGVAKRIRQVLAEPFHLGDQEIRITVSMGIVLSPMPDLSPEAVLQNANIAMHHAIRAGGNRMKVFNPRMFQLAVEAMTMERDLRRGIERDEFFLQYQPIVNLRDDRLIGFEALVRWNHPQRGVLSPGLFIPVAEDSGHIIDLGLVILRKACETMARWLARYPGQDHLHMSVNLSPRQFSQQSLVEQITCILEESHLAPHHLKLEITESTIMDNAEGALSMLRRLKALGIKLSIDDFGTGYSSLSYLQKFPVDTLKVDRSFICDMARNAENTAIVRAVVVLAKSMGLDVVAEGVEEREQMTLLRGLDCDNVQGFYLSHPLDPDSAADLLARSA